MNKQPNEKQQSYAPIPEPNFELQFETEEPDATDIFGITIEADVIPEPEIEIDLSETEDLFKDQRTDKEKAEEQKVEKIEEDRVLLERVENSSVQSRLSDYDPEYIQKFLDENPSPDKPFFLTKRQKTSLVSVDNELHKNSLYKEIKAWRDYEAELEKALEYDPFSKVEEAPVYPNLKQLGGRRFHLRAKNAYTRLFSMDKNQLRDLYLEITSVSLPDIYDEKETRAKVVQAMKEVE